MHAYVVDAQQRPVPVGVPGELLLSGPRLALGYAGRPDVTEEKFVPNPCLDLMSRHIPSKMTVFYQKAYRTGDLVRWRSDQTLHYIGRIDRQVKISGVRIELGEIEAALKGAPSVEAAVASVVPGPDGTKRLVGYVVDPRGVADPALITRHCLSVLIPAMVPRVIIVLEAFPLLPSGKIDTRALPVPDWEGSRHGGGGGEGHGSGGGFVAPSTELEQRLAHLWMELLGLESIGVHDDFWSIGGSSLLGGIMLSKVRSDLGYFLLPSTVIFSCPTIYLLAREVGKISISIGSGRDEEGTAMVCVGGDALTLGGGDIETSTKTITRMSSGMGENRGRLAATSVPRGGGGGGTQKEERKNDHPLPAPHPARLTLQLLGVLFNIAIRLYTSLPIFISALSVGFNYGIGVALAVSGPVALGSFLVCGLIIVGLKWIVMGGRYRPGVYRVWGWYHLRWWFTRQLLTWLEVPLKMVQGSACHNCWLRLLGARIGRGATINSCLLSEVDLIEVGTVLHNGYCTDVCIIEHIPCGPVTGQLVHSYLLTYLLTYFLAFFLFPRYSLFCRLAPVRSSKWMPNLNQQHTNQDIDSSSRPSKLAKEHVLVNVALCKVGVLYLLAVQYRP